MFCNTGLNKQTNLISRNGPEVSSTEIHGIWSVSENLKKADGLVKNRLDRGHRGNKNILEWWLKKLGTCEEDKWVTKLVMSC